MATMYVKCHTFATDDPSYDLGWPDGSVYASRLPASLMVEIMARDWGFTKTQARRMVANSRSLQRDIPGAFIAFST